MYTHTHARIYVYKIHKCIHEYKIYLRYTRITLHAQAIGSMIRNVDLN